jgi:hypothetical protein
LSLYETARQALASLPPERPQLLTGADVLGLGVPEGPLVGRLLRAAMDALDDLPHADASRERALELLRDLVLRTVKPSP